MESAATSGSGELRSGKRNPQPEPTVTDREPDLTDGIELSHFRFAQQGAMLFDTKASITLGDFVASGAGISGIAKRIVATARGTFVSVQMSNPEKGKPALRWLWFSPGCQIYGDMVP